MCENLLFLNAQSYLVLHDKNIRRIVSHLLLGQRHLSKFKEDIYQEAALEVLKTFSCLREKGKSFTKTSLYLTVRRATFEYLRSFYGFHKPVKKEAKNLKRIPSLRMIESTPENTVKGSDSLLKEVSIKREREKVNKLLLTLTKREREIIRLRYFDGLTVEEIGIRLGVAKSYVSTLKKEALSKLKKRYLAKYKDCEIFESKDFSYLKNIRTNPVSFRYTDLVA